MKLETYRHIVLSQFDAAFAMLEECIAKCPAAKWKGKVGKYAFWHVAYHTLYCTDLYTARTAAEWKPHPKFHPGGASDVEDEDPSRVMTKPELLAYVTHCRKRLRASIRRETESSLAGPAGFPWLSFSRAEAAIYNLRHVQHHTGQLSAFLRKAKVSTRWVKDGRR
ncbi:MAG: DinB family protein [Phycisphaerales bacterium]